MRSLKSSAGKNSLEGIYEAIEKYNPLPAKPVVEPEPVPSPVRSRGISKIASKDFLILEDLSCVNADRVVFEHYDRLEVCKDVFRNKDNRIKLFTPYAGIVHCEASGLFLPSLALTCNIVARLFAEKSTAAAERVLQQYKDKGNGSGYHTVNTILRNGPSGEIIHYPSDSDFPFHGGSKHVNQGKRASFPFNRHDLASKSLEAALAFPQYKIFIQNLTGLEHPEILIDIGRYFRRTSYLWLRADDVTTSAWFGCGNICLILNANYGLYNDGGARGVRAERSEAER